MGGIKRKSTGYPAFFPQGHAQLSSLDHFSFPPYSTLRACSQATDKCEHLNLS